MHEERRINSLWLRVICRLGSPGFFPRAEKVTSVPKQKGCGCSNGNPVRVTPKIFDGIAKPVKRLFDIRAPVFVIQACF